MKKQANVILKDFQIQRPAYSFKQDHITEWLALAYAHSEAIRSKRKELSPEVLNKTRVSYLKRSCKSTQIATRGFEVADMNHTRFKEMDIYRIGEHQEDQSICFQSPSGVGTLKRTDFFSEVAHSVFARMYQEQSAPSHIVHVTCTGYVSPSPAQDLVNARGWNDQTAVTNAYHMGCYASLPAVRMARGFVAAGDETVDVVHTEVCSLHMNPVNHTHEQTVVNSLFADGHIKYTVSASGPGLEVLSIKEHLVPHSTSAMTWKTSEFGNRMTLSREVPRLIAEQLPKFLESLCSDEIRKDCIYAIHPGGPRIIEGIADLLKLNESQVRYSKEILHDYGNMSSATLPHIWEKILREAKEGEYIVSLAFGPGLTVFGSLMRKRGDV